VCTNENCGPGQDILVSPSPKLRWSDYVDDDDNTCYEALSLVYEEGFYYRVTPRLVSDSVTWMIEDSAEELAAGRCDAFESPEAAKKICQRIEDEHREYALEEAAKENGEESVDG